jgi:nucleoid DNA-binding protein
MLKRSIRSHGICTRNRAWNRLTRQQIHDEPGFSPSFTAPFCEIGYGRGAKPLECGFVSTPDQGDTMAKGPLSKSALIQTLADKSPSKLSRKDVKGILEAVASIGHTELKKNGLFVVPGLVRMVVVKKPATKARKGINPFTGLETMFKAKPARKVIKGRPVKAAKDAVA